MSVTVKQIENLFYVEINFNTVWEAPFENRAPAETMAFYIRKSFSDGQSNARAEFRRVIGIED